MYFHTDAIVKCRLSKTGKILVIGGLLARARDWHKKSQVTEKTKCWCVVGEYCAASRARSCRNFCSLTEKTKCWCVVAEKYRNGLVRFLVVRGLDRAHFQKEPPLGVVTQSTQFSVALWRVVSDSQRMNGIGERIGLSIVHLTLCAALASAVPGVGEIVIRSALNAIQ